MVLYLERCSPDRPIDGQRQVSPWMECRTDEGEGGVARGLGWCWTGQRGEGKGQTGLEGEEERRRDAPRFSFSRKKTGQEQKKREKEKKIRGNKERTHGY